MSSVAVFVFLPHLHCIKTVNFRSGHINIIFQRRHHIGKELVENAYNRAKELLKTHQDQHRQVAELLLEREVIFSDDLERILGKRPWKDDEEEETKEEKTVENEIKSL